MIFGQIVFGKIDENYEICEKKNFVPQHFPFWKQYDIIYKER